MKKAKLFIVFLIPLLAAAQTPEDSVKYFQKEQKKLWDENYHQYTHSDQYTTLQEGLDRSLARSANYSAFIIFGELVHNNYTGFNNSIAQNGFTPLSALSFRVGMGFSAKSGRLIFDYYFFTLGFNNSTNSGNQKIKTSLSNITQLNLGFDLLQSRWISLYPYAGVGARISSLSYSKPPQTNAGYTNISNIVVNDQSSITSSLRIGYQAGIGLDILLLQTNKNRGGIMLFAKFGTDGPIWADKYKIDGINYEPGFHQGDWLASFGIKFISRQ